MQSLLLALVLLQSGAESPVVENPPADTTASPFTESGAPPADVVPPPGDAPIVEIAPGQALLDAGVELAPTEATVETNVEAPGVPTSGDDSARVVPQQDFVKGELSVFLGSDRVVTKNGRVVVAGGVDVIDDVFYARAEPQIDLRLLDRKLALGVGVPLRFEILSLKRDPTTGNLPGFANAGKLRAEDYDEASDFAQILKYVTYGRKEERLYVNVGQRYASSIGHGAIVRRYAPNVNIDNPRVSAQVDAYNDYAGFEVLTGDIVEWNVMSALAFVKPFAPLTDNPYFKRFSVGVTGAIDRNAPSQIEADANGVRRVENGEIAATRTQVVLAGIDAEMKVVKTRNVDVKPYVDYSMLVGGDSGLTFGALSRFNVGEDIVNAFRLITEVRVLGSRYKPSYFDTFYEKERFQYRVEDPPPGSTIRQRTLVTKREDTLSGRTPNRMGYYVEGSYGIRGRVGVTLALEGATQEAEKNFVAHVEVPAVNFLQFFGSYYKRGFTNLKHITQINNLDEQAGDAIFFAGARLKVLPILFFNARAFKTFRVDPALQRYQNNLGYALDIEFGWEFGDDDPPPPPTIRAEEGDREREQPAPVPEVKQDPAPEETPAPEAAPTEAPAPEAPANP